MIKPISALRLLDASFTSTHCFWEQSRWIHSNWSNVTCLCLFETKAWFHAPLIVQYGLLFLLWLFDLIRGVLTPLVSHAITFSEAIICLVWPKMEASISGFRAQTALIFSRSFSAPESFGRKERTNRWGPLRNTIGPVDSNNNSAIIQKSQPAQMPDVVFQYKILRSVLENVFTPINYSLAEWFSQKNMSMSHLTLKS